MVGLAKERLDFPSLVAAFRCISKMRRQRGKENRVGSKHWGVALGVGIQEVLPSVGEMFSRPLFIGRRPDAVCHSSRVL